ncbi:MAG: tetratricopeptide repeat protein, partial [Sphingobacteriales bacterium]
LLFGIHPMRVESVAWITERKEVLYGMFFMAALVSYINYVQKDKGKTKWYVLIIILSLLSYFAKVQAVTLPLSMIAIDFYLKRKWWSPKILIIEKLPLWILSLIFGLLSIYFLGQNKSIDSDSLILVYSFADKLAVGALSYATYLAKWIYPYLMSPVYPYPKTVATDAYIALVIVPVALIAFLIWAFKNKKTTLLFGWAFFTFNVMFLLQVLPAGQGFLADRFTYIAYFGLFFLTAKAVEWAVLNKPNVKSFAYAGIGLYFVLFIFLTNRQIKVWQNGGVLWDYVKKQYPSNPLAWGNGAYYYREEEKDYNKAIEYYNKAIDLEPEKASVRNSLAKTYFDQCLTLPAETPNYNVERQRLAQLAIASYIEAEKKDSIAGKKDVKNTGEIVVNKGVAFAIMGDLAKAETEITRGIAINPKNANGYLNRSLLYINSNRFELAIKDYDEYIKLDAFNADVFYERGVCKNALGKYAEALPDLDKAISLKNTQALYFVERAKSYKALGNIVASKSDITQAQKMGAKIPPELLQ